MSLPSDVSETETPSASHFICGDICYSLGNYCSHPGFTAHSQAAIFLSPSTMNFLAWGKLVGQVLKTIGIPRNGSQNEQFPMLFPQKLKLHFLHRLFFNINSTFPCVEFMNSDSLIPESSCGWKGSLRSLPIHTKSVRSFRAVIWTELQPKTENWKGKLPHVLLSQLAGQPACATAGLLFQIFPLRALIWVSLFLFTH